MSQRELTALKSHTRKELEKTYNEYRSKVLDMIPLEKRKYWTNRVDASKSLESKLQILEKIEKYWSK